MHIDYAGLIFDDGLPVDSQEDQDLAIFCLLEPLRSWIAQQGLKGFVGSNSAVYYQRDMPAIVPDFYVGVGGEQLEQPGWVAGLEGELLPNMVVEILSPSTESEDRGRKFCLYRDELKVGDYFLYKAETQRIEGFHLEESSYVAVTPDGSGRVPCSCLPLTLGVHNGKLRFFTADGNVLPTAQERAEEALRRADEERRRAEAAEKELQRLQEELRRLKGESG